MNDNTAALQARVASDRQELARTVQALAEKVDVPARTRAAAVSLEDKIRAMARRCVRTEYVVPAALVVAVIAASVAAARWRRS